MNPLDSLVDRVLLGDCTRLLRELPPASVDFVLTDPPHLASRGVGNAWLEPAFAEIGRVLKPDRFCVSSYSWGQAERFLSVCKAVGLWPAGHLVWVRPYCVRDGFLRWKHEVAYLLAKGHPAAPREPIPDVLPWEGSGSLVPSSGVMHPGGKPPRALEPLLRSFSKPGDVVLDPFAGSGSTLVMARRMGRRFIGIERDREYHDLACKRLEGRVH